MLESLRKAPRDRAAALLLGLALAALAYWLSPKTLDYRVWQPLCEGALLRPPEGFLPGLYRLVVHASTRFLGLGATVRILQIAGPVALGVVAYESVRLAMTLSTAILRPDEGRREFRNVMMPLLAAAGMGLFLTSGPVLHAAWMLTPSILVLSLTFLVAGAFRIFFTRGVLVSGYLGMFGAGVLSAECPLGLVLALAAEVQCFRVFYGGQSRLPLARPEVFHVVKWALTVLFLFGAGTMLSADAWFFGMHGGAWLEGLRTAAHFYLPDLQTVLLLCVVGGAPLVVAWALALRSCDSEIYLPYANGVLLLLLALASVLFCRMPDSVPLRDEWARMVLLFTAAFTAVVCLQVLLVDVYCRVQTRYPKLLRMALFRLVLAGLLAVSALDVGQDGARKIARAVGQGADELAAECAGMKRLFSDGALDELVEIKAALSGRRLLVHSMLGGREVYAERLRSRDELGDEDMSMMRIGASVALGSWVRFGSPKLQDSAVQLGLELWRRQGRPLPPVGGLAAVPDSVSDAERLRAQAWADDFAERVLAGDFRQAYARCREKRWREAFDMLTWRLGRMFELRAAGQEKRGNLEDARRLRRTSVQLDRENASLDRLRGFLNLPWSPDTLQLTPREALQVALGRSDFRAARPHAEAVLSSDPRNASANFALGMYHYVQRDFERADVYLEAAHRIRPGDTAILNNLAVVRMCRNDLASAEQLALQALELKPGTKEIEATLAEIRRRIKAR